MEQLKRKAALGIFALLVIAAPLLFGGVDREVQVGLVALLGLGLIFVQPSAPRLSPWGKRLFGLWIALIVVKEFAPWKWFGATRWRSTLMQSYDLAFPWSHNPEPGRVVDALLVLTLGLLWFLWVRTLAAESDDRPFMLWSLLASSGALAVVCLAMHPADPHRIYGFYFSGDWMGYGPFPNRNHTACFLAMGTVLGCGTLTNAIRHKKQLPAVASFVLLLLIIVALLLSKSRGGLIALVIGLGVYAALVLCKMRNRAALFSIAGGGLFFAVIFVAFGSKVISRFHAAGEGEIPTNIRWDIWKNTLVMWRDAPLFGHGLSTFQQVFPLYQSLKLENQMLAHPESSWLLWLAEMGIIPLLIAAGAGAVFLFRNVRDAFERKQGFFTRACAFAAFSVLVFHSIWDVPAHRWATAGYALAILALACPLSSRPGKKIVLGKRVVLVPFAIVVFWLLPYFSNFPAWSPTYLTRLISVKEDLITVNQLESALRWFPLSPSLHYSLGTHLLSEYREPQAAWSHFRITDRLVPNSWSLPAAEAAASRPFSSGMTLHFWSLAIERSGHRAEELFIMALRDTERMPVASLFWNNYVESNPQLLLSYAQNVEGADGRYYFQKWWNDRASSDDLAQFEIDDFYTEMPKYGRISMLYEWMSHHPSLEETDYKTWAALLHLWKDDASAWKLLSKRTSEPDYPTGTIAGKQDALETKWFADPTNAVNAQELARIYASTGHTEQAREVIIAVASQENAPPWFLQKAAFLQAADGRFGDAVKYLLRAQ